MAFWSPRQACAIWLVGWPIHIWYFSIIWYLTNTIHQQYIIPPISTNTIHQQYMIPQDQPIQYINNIWYDWDQPIQYINNILYHNFPHFNEKSLFSGNSVTSSNYLSNMEYIWWFLSHHISFYVSFGVT